jgi:dephospho-CoA kinase
MLKIGLTGGIGSGKTTVANLFAKLGAPVIDADKIAKKLMEPASPCFTTVVEHFGPSILMSNGDLDREVLSNIIFSHPEEKKWLENLLHPKVIAHMQAEANQVGYPYCIFAIPLLVEANCIDLVDQTLVVDCSEILQLNRTKKRDNMSLNQVQAIIDSQCKREDRIEMANDIITNEDDFQSLEQQVKKLHEKYSLAS